VNLRGVGYEGGDWNELAWDTSTHFGTIAADLLQGQN